MSLWLILVTLPASFFRILRCVLPTSIWTRFMKNRITRTESSPTEEICDRDTVEKLGDNDSCYSSDITNRPQSGILNLSSRTSDKNEKSNEDEFHFESSMNKQKSSIPNLFVDKTEEFKSDDSICVSTHQTLTALSAEKNFTITYRMIVNRQSNSVLTKYKKTNYSETNNEISGCISGDKITNEESGDKITDEESGDKITVEESGDKITVEESGDKITVEESGDKITDEESGDKITDEESGDKINNAKFIEASGDEITGEASGDEITGEASGDEISERKFEDQTTDTMDKNDNGESNNKILDHECCDVKNLIHEECPSTSELTILPEFSSKIDDCQPTFKRYFDHNNIMFLSDLYIPEDPFLLSPTNDMALCEFSHEIKDNISAITRESSDDFIPNELKPDVCDMNDSCKYSLDTIPMEFIYPCLPHFMNYC